MPTSIIDNAASFDAPITPPAAGEPRNASGLITFAQQLANRTAFLNAAINTNGVTLLRNGTAAAMVALSGVVTGSLFFVTNQGIYSYQPGGAYVVDSLYVYTSVGMGGGQWVDIDFLKANVNNGFARLSSVGKVANSQLSNAIQGVYMGGQGLTAQVTVSTVLSDIPGYTLTIPSVAIGDKLYLNWTILIWNTVAASATQWVPIVVDANLASTLVVSPYVTTWACTATSPSTLVAPQVYTHVITAATAGTYIAKAQFATPSTNQAQASQPSSITCLHVRP